MRISYHKDTDSLYIHLNDKATEESEEIASGTVLHFDEDGSLTGIEIYYNASEQADLSELDIAGLGDTQAPTVKISDWVPHVSLDRGGPWEEAVQAMRESIKPAGVPVAQGRIFTQLEAVSRLGAIRLVDMKVSKQSLSQSMNTLHREVL